MSKTTKNTRVLTLEEILGLDVAALTHLNSGTFETRKVGDLCYTQLAPAEHADIKKKCMIQVPDGSGGYRPDMDDDKMMRLVVIEAVDKDKQSNFTFANKALLDKLGKATASEALEVLLDPGEIYELAMEIQTASGFGRKAAKAATEAVKNS